MSAGRPEPEPELDSRPEEDDRASTDRPTSAGERIDPGDVEPGLWAEHMARYRIAAALAPGRRVLDLGCGVGYGERLLSEAGAELVVATDASLAALLKSPARTDRVHLVGSLAQRCAFAASSFDLVVSFEVIEHLASPEAYLEEIHRLLREDGLLVLSTPNKKTYTDDTGFNNPFHVNELYLENLEKLLQGTFSEVRLLGQTMIEAQMLHPFPEASPPSQVLPPTDPFEPTESMYFVALCAPRRLPKEARRLGSILIPGPTSELARLRRRLVRLETEHHETATWAQRLAGELESRDQEIATLRQEVGELTSWALAMRARLHEERRRGELAEGIREHLARSNASFHRLAPEPAATELIQPASTVEAARERTRELEIDVRAEPDSPEQSPLVDLLELLDALREERRLLSHRLSELDGEHRRTRNDLALLRAELSSARAEAESLRNGSTHSEAHSSEPGSADLQGSPDESQRGRIPGLLAQLRELEERNTQIPALLDRIHALEGQTREIPALRQIIEQEREELRGMPAMIGSIRELELEVQELTLACARAEHLQARAREIPTLLARIRRLEDIEHEARDLREQLAAHEAELASWKKHLIESPQEGPAEVAARVGRLRSAEDRVEELEQRLLAAEEARAAALHRAEEIAQSTMWRATAPLRRLLDRIRGRRQR